MLFREPVLKYPDYTYGFDGGCPHHTRPTPKKTSPPYQPLALNLPLHPDHQPFSKLPVKPKRPRPTVPPTGARFPPNPPVQPHPKALNSRPLFKLKLASLKPG